MKDAQLKNASRLLCAAGALFPLIGGVGWAFKVDLFTRGHPALPAMPPNTILGLLLMAIAVFLTGKSETSNWKKYFAVTLAVCVVTLGLATLSEYVLGWDLGIDRVLVENFPTPGAPFPGRPSPQASANFVLLGLSILWHNFTLWNILFGQLLAVLAGANSIVAMTGYIFSVEEFYGFPVYNPLVGMAVNAAISFVILSGALLFTRAKHGLMTLLSSDFRTSEFARRIFAAVLLLPLLLGAATRVGVGLGWYDHHTHVSNFVVALCGAILAVTWRTARLSEAEERRSLSAHQELAQAVRTREDILAIVSHDLKNPITAIQYSTDVLKEPRQRTVENYDDIIRIIESATKEMRSIISNLLDFAKISSGTFCVDRAPTNFSEITDPIIEIQRPLAHTKKQTLTIELAQTLPPIFCDASRVRLVLSNLMGNAIKFTGQGGKVTLKAATSKNDIHVSVCDTGPGIAAENLPKLFDRYWQADATRHQGTGLGLSIAKGIVESHGGRIWAESTLGQGTTIHFTLPIAAEVPAESHATAR